MNKSQHLDVMKIRAKINTQELLKQHQIAWYGQEPKLIKDVKKEKEGVTDGTKR